MRPSRCAIVCFALLVVPLGQGIGAAAESIVTKSTATQPVPSVAEARRMRDLEQGAKEGEARSFYQQGLNAQAAGKPGIARILYQMAARRASGELRARILRRLDVLRLEARSPQKTGREF